MAHVLNGRTAMAVCEGNAFFFLKPEKEEMKNCPPHPLTSLLPPDKEHARFQELGSLPINRLVELIAQGDRDAAAVLVTKYEPMLRRRIRAQLSAATRRLFDTQDVFSTVCRRFDRFVGGRRVKASTPGELLSLLARIAQNSVVDKRRVMRQVNRIETEDSEFYGLLRARSGTRWKDDAGFELDIRRLAGALDEPRDRSLLFRWLAGRSLEQIAVELGITPELARKRWQLVRARLRDMLTMEVHP
jgi:RNA polymerase sigma factor (sigma-70 family)